MILELAELAKEAFQVHVVPLLKWQYLPMAIASSVYLMIIYKLCSCGRECEVMKAHRCNCKKEGQEKKVTIEKADNACDDDDETSTSTSNKAVAFLHEHPFEFPDDFTAIPGIGEKTKKHLTGTSFPINVHIEHPIQLLGLYLLSRSQNKQNLSVNDLRKHHEETFAALLASMKVGSHQKVIARAIAEKCDHFIPNSLHDIGYDTRKCMETTPIVLAVNGKEKCVKESSVREGRQRKAREEAEEKQEEEINTKQISEKKNE